MKRGDWVIMGVILSMVIGCETRSVYDRLVERELATGEVNDSLFLDFYFGQTSKEFFENGWKQNKKGLIAQGPGNQTVRYVMPNDKKGESPIHMLFYPDFDEQGKVKLMNLTFNYSGWAPWNRKFFSDSLLVAVQDTLMNWYGGNAFITITMDDQKNDLLVKVDGNRMISLTVEGEQNVQGYIKDLTNTENKE